MATVELFVANQAILIYCNSKNGGEKGEIQFEHVKEIIHT